MTLDETLYSARFRMLAIVAAALVGMGVLMFAKDVLADGDTYWHIATGRWILQHGYVPHHDPFSYTKPGALWQAHEWLAEVLMGGAYLLGDWNGVSILFGLAAALAAGLLANHLAGRIGGISLVTLLAFSLASTSQSLLYRPHLLMLPMLVFWTSCIISARDKGRAPPVALALLMVAWANLHGSFLFGFVIAGAFGLEALIEAPTLQERVKVIRDWGVFGALAAVATVITPHGIPGLLFPFQVLGMSTLKTIREWLPYSIVEFSPFQLGLYLALFVIMSRGVKIKPMRVLLLLGLLYMSLEHRRQLIILAVVAPMILAEPMAEALGQRLEPLRRVRPALIAAAAGLLVLIGARFAMPMHRVDDPVSPITAVGKLPPQIRARPVLNDYAMGGFLIFSGIKPYIDGRADMYGDAFVKDYMDLINSNDQAHLRRVLTQHNIVWSVGEPNDRVVKMLDQEPGWTRFHSDSHAVLQVRKDALAAAGVTLP